MDVSQPLAYPNMIDVHKAPVKTCYMLVHYTSSLLSSSVNDSENIAKELIIRYLVPSFRVDISLIGMLDCFLPVVMVHLIPCFSAYGMGLIHTLLLRQMEWTGSLSQFKREKKLLSVWFSLSS